MFFLICKCEIYNYFQIKPKNNLRLIVLLGNMLFCKINYVYLIVQELMSQFSGSGNLGRKVKKKKVLLNSDSHVLNTFFLAAKVTIVLKLIEILSNFPIRDSRMDSNAIAGVDLGTTHSRVAILIENEDATKNRVEIVKVDELEKVLLPHYVFPMKVTMSTLVMLPRRGIVIYSMQSD